MKSCVVVVVVVNSAVCRTLLSDFVSSGVYFSHADQVLRPFLE